jgi:hypothetical protein
MKGILFSKTGYSLLDFIYLNNLFCGGKIISFRSLYCGRVGQAFSVFYKGASCS